MPTSRWARAPTSAASRPKTGSSSAQRPISLVCVLRVASSSASSSALARQNASEGRQRIAVGRVVREVRVVAGQFGVAAVEEEGVDAGQQQHRLALARRASRSSPASSSSAAMPVARRAYSGARGLALRANSANIRAQAAASAAQASPVGTPASWLTAARYCRGRRGGGTPSPRGSMTDAMDLLADLEARGLIQESTDRAALAARLAPGAAPLTLYYGCDPTADSLHHGNLIGLIMLRRFQDAGHFALALAGGATGMIGDPSGRSDERNLLDDETLDRNVAAIKAQIGRIVDLDDERGRLVDNRDWTQPLSLLDVPARRRQATPRSTRCWPGRASASVWSPSTASPSPSSATCSCRPTTTCGCTTTWAASCRWADRTSGATSSSGVDLIRRKRQVAVHALAWPLLMAADGTKLGKTTGARLWLDPAKTSPYQFHQHWMQLGDQRARAAVQVLLPAPARRRSPAMLAEHATAPERRLAQRALADEVTALVHGEAAARAAGEAADVLFGGDPLGGVPGGTGHAWPARCRRAGPPRPPSSDVVELLASTGLASSKSDARRQLEQGAVRVNGVVVGMDDDMRTLQLLHDRYLLVRKGKRSYHLVEIFADEVDGPAARR